MTTLHSGSLTAIDYRCTATPQDRPFTEVFPAHVLAYVHRGSFGCCARGRSFQLVPGAVLIGYPGDEYVCTHDHHDCRDECLSFRLSPETAERLSLRAREWRVGYLPPLPRTLIAGELARAAATGRCDIGIDEAGELLAARVVQTLSDARASFDTPRTVERRRAMEIAQWIEAHFAEETCLDSLAQRARLSPYHFLRLFAAVLGVTPHQYLVRVRLRSAARLLIETEQSVTEIALAVGFADLSNFVRSFRRAADLAPSEFRRVARANRNFFQEAMRRAH